MGQDAGASQVASRKAILSPGFVYIHRAKSIFSRDMFCLYHFRAKIYGVSCQHSLFFQMQTIWTKELLKEQCGFWFTLCWYRLKSLIIFFNTPQLFIDLESTSSLFKTFLSPKMFKNGIVCYFYNHFQQSFWVAFTESHIGIFIQQTVDPLSKMITFEFQFTNSTF